MLSARGAGGWTRRLGAASAPPSSPLLRFRRPPRTPSPLASLLHPRLQTADPRNRRTAEQRNSGTAEASNRRPPSAYRANSGPADQRTNGTLYSLLVCTLLCLAFLLATSAPGAAQQIRYGYDDLGRLQWVQDPNGEVAIYVYDPVGNILQIIRGDFPDPNAPVGISAFTPTKGPIGMAVTVFGRGFGGDPALTQVTFSGAPAAVTAASPTQLTALVPAGATTGPIAVTAPAGTATSAQAFTVLVTPEVSPASAVLFPKMTQTFTATQPAQWRANNIVGGSPAVGTLTVSADGLTAIYTAPAAVPPTGVVTITAAHRDDFTLGATATVEVLAPTDQLRAPPVSVARSVGLLPPGLLPGALVSVARAPAALSASPLAAPLLSVEWAPTAVSASPLAATLLSVDRAPAPVSASPLAGRLLAAAREPVVTAVEDPATGQPARVTRGTTQAVRLRGAGFTGATAVVFNLAAGPDANITVNGFTVDSPAQITATITIAAGAETGLRVARVTAGGATSTAQGTGENFVDVLP